MLSKADVADFRERLCEAAERLFAEQGPEAVTMRQLATELGVSPMTPYRYFADKDDILAAVRAGGFERFAIALEAAAAAHDDPVEKSSAVGEAYIAFALAHPQTYKLMFDLNQPGEERFPLLQAAAERARHTMGGHVAALIDAGLIEGDADLIAHTFWAATHGAVVLHLAGKLDGCDLRSLSRASAQAIFQGLRPRRP